MGRYALKYLGIVMDGRCLPTTAYDPILQRARQRINGWKAKALSFAGKVTFHKAVLQALPTDVLGSGWVLASVIRKLEGDFLVFL